MSTYAATLAHRLKQSKTAPALLLKLIQKNFISLELLKFHCIFLQRHAFSQTDSSIEDTLHIEAHNFPTFKYFLHKHINKNKYVEIILKFFILSNSTYCKLMYNRTLYSFHYSLKYILNILTIEIFLFYSGIVLTNIFGAKEALVKNRHARKGIFQWKQG